MQILFCMNLMNRKQYNKFLRSLDVNVCTFCDPTKQVVLKDFNNWYWIANIAPYWAYHTMVVSKRHFEKYSDMTMIEAGELVEVINYGEKKIIDAKLTRKDGTLIEKVVYFWRHRTNRFDAVTGTVKPAHFHLSLTPDCDGLWNKVVDPKACEWDVNLLK